MLPMRHGFLGSVPLRGLGAITDPKILARVDLAEAFGNALKSVSQVVNVSPETMATSIGTARETFKALIKNPSFIGYTVKVLVLAAIMVKENIRALGFTPEQLGNILQGADEAVRGVVSAEDLPGRLKASEEEIVSRAPENIREEVRKIVATTGVTVENLAPNLPPEALREKLENEAPKEGMSGLEKAALIGIPVAILAAIGVAWKG